MENITFSIPEQFSFNDKDIEANYEIPTFFNLRYKIIGTIFQSSIFIVGILGNIMVGLVVFKTRSMHTPTNYYLFTLAIADCIVLFTSVPNEVASYYLIGNEWIYGRAGCAIFIFLQYLGINASSLCLTAFSVERYIAICLPLKSHIVCTTRRAKHIVIFLWIFATLYCSPWLILTTTKPLYYKGRSPVMHCTFNLSRKKYLAYYFFDFLIFYIIPLILSCVLYGLMIKVLLVKQFPTEAGSLPCKEANSIYNARIQVVRMLFVVVAIFACLWLPYRGMLVHNSFINEKEMFLDLWFLMFAKTCVYINSAINPFLYSTMSIKFRTAFRKLLLGQIPKSSRRRKNTGRSAFRTEGAVEQDKNEEMSRISSLKINS